MGCSLLAARQFHKRMSSVLRRIFMSLVSVKHSQNYVIPFPKAHFTHFKKSCIPNLGLFVSYLVSMEPQKVPFMVKAIHQVLKPKYIASADENETHEYSRMLLA